MLKSKTEDQIWLVQQHHHAQVSGYLAAHWGGENGFSRPGQFPGATDPDKWREEVVLGIAEHDNGWWESEAMPRISDQDGLPIGVGEAAAPTVANEFNEWRSNGFDRWRVGINRLSRSHPYAALLVSLHAYWLYAVAFDDLVSEDSNARRHFVFGAPEVASGLVGDPKITRSFLGEQVGLQEGLKLQLRRDPSMATAVEPEYLDPHLRLLQLMDSMSLYLALNDHMSHTMHHIPKQSWEDRCSISWRYSGERTIALDPFPFDLDPLPVLLPVRILREDERQKTIEERTPLALLHGTPLETVEFNLVSG